MARETQSYGDSTYYQESKPARPLRERLNGLREIIGVAIVGPIALAAALSGPAMYDDHQGYPTSTSMVENGDRTDKVVGYAAKALEKTLLSPFDNFEADAPAPNLQLPPEMTATTAPAPDDTARP